MKLKKIDNLLVKHKFSKNVKKIGLLLSYDDRKHPVLNISNGDNYVLLHKFCGRFDLDKFLVEAVLLRMSVPSKDLTGVRNIYNYLIDFLNEERGISDNAIL